MVNSRWHVKCPITITVAMVRGHIEAPIYIQETEYEYVR